MSAFFIGSTLCKYNPKWLYAKKVPAWAIVFWRSNWGFRVLTPSSLLLLIAEMDDNGRQGSLAKHASLLTRGRRIRRWLNFIVCPCLFERQTRFEEKRANELWWITSWEYTEACRRNYGLRRSRGCTNGLVVDVRNQSVIYSYDHSNYGSGVQFSKQVIWS